MRLYGITRESIHKVLEGPERVVPTAKGRYNAYKKIGRRYLRVTYKEEETRFLVITVTPRRKFEGGFHEN
ncbi:MAG: hypothetical protein HY666_02660 [Chloroflexi bacterium]|nr:hypothetical protein [Chloroflexota bacterium]